MNGLFSAEPPSGVAVTRGVVAELELAPPGRLAPGESKALAEERANFRQRCCSLFDGFIRQGLDVKEATKRTNFAMKDKGHPWATFDVISKELRDAGRFRKVKGHPQG